jgi:hypothetical protein
MGLFRILLRKVGRGADSQDQTRTPVRELTGGGPLYHPQNAGKFTEHLPVAELGFPPEKPRARPSQPQRSDPKPPTAESQKPRSRKDSLTRQAEISRRRERPGPPVPPKNDVEVGLSEVHRPFSFADDEPLQESLDARVNKFSTRPRGFGDELCLEPPASLQRRGAVRRGRTVVERPTGHRRDDDASRPRQVRFVEFPASPTSSSRRAAQAAEVNANSTSFASKAYHDSQRLADRRLGRSRTHGHYWEASR